MRSNWSATILVCGKCSKKLGGGFGEKGRTPLAKALRKLAGGKKRKADFGVIETRCLGVCPKGAVTVIDAAHPGKWMLVEEGAPIDELAARLGLPS
ncbi:(2Fe-2S) ferredoxin domain-containing protein [Sphingomonas chungangi]|uniref:(2Fe-2S) ferredoxin domain-containing protein n=1 Tax=Sphingomonas chungangi TaxID=2683589 RepID=UPI0031B617BC